MKTVFISLCVALVHHGIAQEVGNAPMLRASLQDEQHIAPVVVDGDRSLISVRGGERDLRRKKKKGRRPRPSKPAAAPTTLLQKYETRSTFCELYNGKRFACRKARQNGSKVCRFTRERTCVTKMKEPKAPVQMSTSAHDKLDAKCARLSRRRRVCRRARMCTFQKGVGCISAVKRETEAEAAELGEDEDDDDQEEDEDDDDNDDQGEDEDDDDQGEDEDHDDDDDQGDDDQGEDEDNDDDDQGEDEDDDDQGEDEGNDDDDDQGEDEDDNDQGEDENNDDDDDQGEDEDDDDQGEDDDDDDDDDDQGEDEN